MTKDTGGPAFPRTEFYAAAMEREGIEATYPGMTLRDHFAGQVRIAIGTWTPNYDKPELIPGKFIEWSDECLRLECEARAAYCYAEADAMIAERSKP